MPPLDITVADWLEVIRAEAHEIPGLHPLLPESEERRQSELRTFETLVLLAEIEWLKRARRDTYVPAN